MKFLLIASFGDSILNFRGALLRELMARNCEVHVAAPGLDRGSELYGKLLEFGVIPHSIRLKRTGKNLIEDLLTCVELTKLMRRVRPHTVLAYTVKPVVYGAFAAKWAGVPQFYAMITGLGHAFQGEQSGGRLQGLVQRLYKAALKSATRVIFQNPDDEMLFRSRGILDPQTPSIVINGSGIDLCHYQPAALPSSRPTFLLIARLLREKGVCEYAAAAKLVRKTHPHARFVIGGWIDDNPSAISQQELDDWIASGTLEYLGRLSDVREAIASANVYVLPSYREGTPRTVLEAMAMSRCIITTDAPGCRETVVSGLNGYLVRVGAVEELAIAMRKLVDNPIAQREMGAASRRIAEEKYDVIKVNRSILSALNIV